MKRLMLVCINEKFFFHNAVNLTLSRDSAFQARACVVNKSEYFDGLKSQVDVISFLNARGAKKTSKIKLRYQFRYFRPQKL